MISFLANKLNVGVRIVTNDSILMTKIDELKSGFFYLVTEVDVINSNSVKTIFFNLTFTGNFKQILKGDKI